MEMNIVKITSKNLKKKLKRPNVNLELSFLGGMPIYRMERYLEML